MLPIVNKISINYESVFVAVWRLWRFCCRVIPAKRSASASLCFSHSVSTCSSSLSSSPHPLRASQSSVRTLDHPRRPCIMTWMFPGKYYLLCIVIVALSLIITTLVLTLHHHATVKPVPEKVWTKCAFLNNIWCYCDRAFKMNLRDSWILLTITVKLSRIFKNHA